MICLKLQINCTKKKNMLYRSKVFNRPSKSLIGYSWMAEKTVVEVVETNTNVILSDRFVLFVDTLIFERAERDKKDPKSRVSGKRNWTLGIKII